MCKILCKVLGIQRQPRWSWVLLRVEKPMRVEINKQLITMQYVNAGNLEHPRRHMEKALGWTWGKRSDRKWYQSK